MITLAVITLKFDPMEDRGAGQEKSRSIRGGRREEKDRKIWSSEKNFPYELKDIRKDISRAEIIC
jgi:hypothetical protein